jgi:HlyD family secretion protein
MNQSTKSKRKWIWIIVGVVVIAILAAAVLNFRGGLQNDNEGVQDGTGEIVTAFIGQLSANATASGQIQAQRDAQLSMGTTGEVAEIFVEVGDEVEAGAPLLKLDTAGLGRAVESAEQALAIQEANLTTLLKPPNAADLAAAEASVASARSQLEDLLAGPAEEDIAASEANVRAAQANVWSASEQLELAQSGATEAEIASAQAELIAALGQQESTQELYDQLLECFTIEFPGGGDTEICPGFGPPEERTRFNLEAAKANTAAAQAQLDALLAGPDADAVSIAQASLAAANARLDVARANHDLLMKGPSEDQIEAAEANLAQAEANLEALRDGPSNAQVVAAETAVEQARISLQRAMNDLVEATLLAPFSGVVTAVNVNEGEVANGILIEMVDPDSLEVVLDVDEVDIGKVSLGQPAVITLESWPDTEITGQVASIAPEAMSNASSLVVYQVFLSLDQTELPVLVGMTANADLLAAEDEEVLLVPNAAINADRSTGTYSVNLVTTDSNGEQQTKEVEVTIGLRDGRYTQITNGLEEGDQILVGDDLPVFRFGEDEPPEEGFGGDSRRPQGGPPFGG